MSHAQLDRIVKGAPPPNVSSEQLAQSARRSSSASSSSITAPHPPPAINDPLSSLPSSPECIYQNLLILEASLRAQHLSLRNRLRLYLILMTALAAWLSAFTYFLFLRPREDGRGAGGSPYWVVDMAEKLGWVGGVVTACLVWATGMWDRGVRWPRRWVVITNRGLRPFNLKLVVIRAHWWQDLANLLAISDLLAGKIKGISFEILPKDIEKHITDNHKDLPRIWDIVARHGWVEEDVAPGGDVIKLLLLPKPFSPDFREDWDTYRTSYWERENERRAKLRTIIKARKRALAKAEGGWLWWVGWTGWRDNRGPARKSDVERRQSVVGELGGYSSLRDKKRRDTLLRESSNSRSSSRSTTPDPDMRAVRRSDPRTRRESSSASTGRKKRSPSNLDGASGPLRSRPSPLTRSSNDSRPPSPSSASTVSDTPSLHKMSSSLSMNSSASDDHHAKKEETPPTDFDIQEEDEQGKR